MPFLPALGLYGFISFFMTGPATLPSPLCPPLSHPLPLLLPFPPALGLYGFISFLMTGPATLLTTVANIDVVPPFDAPWLVRLLRRCRLSAARAVL